MREPGELRRLGSTDVTVSALGVGTASLGDVFGAVSEGHAVELLDAAIRAGLRYVDTAPLYGNGLSETRLGAAFRQLGQPELTISTKVGRILDPSSTDGWRFDFSRDGILRSLESSLQRLGRDRVDVVYLHDPDGHEEQVYAEAWPALEALRDEGVIGAAGVGMNHWEMPLRFVERIGIDVVMLAGRYTLLDQSAGEEFLPACAERGVSVVLAGVFNSGALIDPRDGAWYDYRPASVEILERARAIRDVLAASGLTLPEAALQFAFEAPAVASVVVGVGQAATLRSNLAALERDVPHDVWRDLRALDLITLGPSDFQRT